MADKKTAKIEFQANTKEFNNSIKAANSRMSELSAEIKKNAAELQNGEDATKNLTDAHELLSAKLDAQRQKTEAMRGKLAEAVQIFGENSDEVSRLKIQLTNAETAELRLAAQVDKTAAELQAQTGEVEDTRDAYDKLNDTISEQETKLAQLKREYANAKLNGVADDADRLEREMSQLNGELKDNKKKLSDASSAADDLGDSLEDTSEGAKEADDGINALAAGGIAALIAGVGTAVAGLLELSESTREYRQDQASLQTAFKKAGFTTEAATKTYKDLFAILGEDDRSVETANGISRLAKSEQDLADWTRITAGVFGTYQDSLPVEALAEAAAETAKVGAVTGPFADTLNWSSEAAQMFAKYMSEDVVTAEDAFNVALSECTTEAERQTLITDTLLALYGDSADQYRDTAGATMEQNAATSALQDSQAALGDAMAPMTTAWTNFKSQALDKALPLVEDMSVAFENLKTWVEDNKTAIENIAIVVGIAAAAFVTFKAAMAISSIVTAVTTALNGMTIAQWALNAAMTANPIGLIIAAVAALIAIIVLCVKNWDVIKETAIAVWNKIVEVWTVASEWFNTNVIQPISTFFTNLWNAVSGAFVAAWEWIKTTALSIATWFNDNVIQPISTFFTNLWNAVSGAFVAAWEWIKTTALTIATWFNDNVILPIQAFFAPIVAWFTELFTSIWATLSDIVHNIVVIVTGVWEIIKAVYAIVATWFNENVIQPVAEFFTGMWNGISSAATVAWTAVKNTFSAVATWFNTNIIQPVSKFFGGMWEKFSSAGAKAWDAIKGVFSKVATFFGDIFSKAWNKVKGIFSTGGNAFKEISDGISAMFKKVVNSIIRSINKVVSVPFNAINKVLDKIRGAEILGFKPFEKLGSISVPQIPELAKGGVLTKPTLNIAGEAGAEAIAPIDVLQGYISDAVAATFAALHIDNLIGAVADMASRPIELYIDGHRVAVATAGAADSVNGERVMLNERGLAL